MNVLCFLELALARSGCKCDFCTWSRAALICKLESHISDISDIYVFTLYWMAFRAEVRHSDHDNWWTFGMRDSRILYMCTSDSTCMSVQNGTVANDCYEQLQSTESLYHLIHNRNRLKKRWNLSLDKDSVMESRKHWKALFLNFPQLQCRILSKGPSIDQLDIQANTTSSFLAFLIKWLH